MQLLLLLASMFVTFCSFAQTRQIKGKVINNDDFPMAGVSVMIKGTIYGTSTDADGNYRITTRTDSVTLIFSYLGCDTQQVGVGGGQTTVDVVLNCNIPFATTKSNAKKTETISSPESKRK